MLKKNSSLLIQILERHNTDQIKLNIKKVEKILHLAAINRVTFPFLHKTNLHKKYKNYLSIYLDGEKYWNEILKTNKIIKKSADDLDYMIIKHSDMLKTISSDIDILFKKNKDYKKFIKRLIKKGFLSSSDSKLKSSLTKNGYTKIEPHLDISWYDKKFISKKEIFNNLNKKSNSVSFAINLIHCLLDQNYISAKEYLSLKKYYHYPSIIKFAKDQAKNYGWTKGFNYMIGLIKEIERSPSKKYQLPVWLPLPKVISYSLDKYLFDIDNNLDSFKNLQFLTKPVIFYYWKKLRSKLSKNYYRHSWLY